jgi:hypothetical protein
VRGLLIPWPIFAPVAGRDFFPRVVKVDGLLEVLHGDRVRVRSRAPLREAFVVFACTVRGPTVVIRVDVVEG